MTDDGGVECIGEVKGSQFFGRKVGRDVYGLLTYLLRPSTRTTLLRATLGPETARSDTLTPPLDISESRVRGIPNLTLPME